jgi:hypothetical protein
MEEQKDDDFRRALLVNYNSQVPQEGRQTIDVEISGRRRTLLIVSTEPAVLVENVEEDSTP